MIRLGCARARRLHTSRRSGLREAEELWLEEHLAACAPCREEARALDAVAAMAAEDADRYRPTRHARAITRVLNAGSEAQLPATPAAPRFVPYVFAGAVAAAAVIGVAGYRAGWGGGGEMMASEPREEEPAMPAALAAPAGPPAPDPGEANLASEARFFAGDLRAAGVPVEPGDALEPGSRLETDEGAKVEVGLSRLELSAGSLAVWPEQAEMLRLDAGTVRAEVRRGDHSGFRIETDEFSAHVLGTVFEVTETEVKVEQGAVKVTGPEGDVFADRLEAGDSWQLPGSKDARDQAEAGGAASGDHAADREGPAGGPQATEAASAATLLVRARGELAGERVGAARELIEDARALELSVIERAEAETLLAEAALVGGDRPEAAARYLEVAERYSELRAGENALFAAARIEAERGRRDRATALLSQYLDRYPSGRFFADAERRLEELSE